MRRLSDGKGYSADVAVLEAGGLCGNYGEGAMKLGIVICLIIFVIGAMLALVQLWFVPLDAAVFTKILITLAVLFVVVLGVSIAAREYLDEKKMKDSGHID